MSSTRIFGPLLSVWLIAACGARPSEPATEAGVDGDGPTTPDGPAGCPQCVDDLDCTEDGCAAGGGCEFKLKAGFCLIAGACHADGAADPANACARCAAATSPNAWIIQAEGSACDDGEPCTKEDRCRAGTCQGIAYACAPDWLDCTDDVCDGNGGCSYPIRADRCAIADGPMSPQCYEKGERSAYMPPGSCQACDPTQSQTSWSDVKGCMIMGLCYLPGERDATGCQVCDPARSTGSWSPGTSACQISGQCFQSGDKDKSGCNVCDPARSTSGWSPVAGGCKIGGLCYEASAKDSSGCKVCDPSQSTTAWTPVPSGCQIYGKCYAAGDSDPQGCGTCDPTKSATSWTPRGNVCQIAGKCYVDGAVSPGGCGVCDVQQNASGWSSLPGSCTVSYPQPVPPPYPQPEQCFKAGEKPYPGACEICDPTRSQTGLSPVTAPDCKIDGQCLDNGDSPLGGDPLGPTTSCAVCDATNSTTQWTVLAGTCFIYGQCFQGGEVDPMGCQLCDPTKTQTEWSPVTGKCSIPLFSMPGGPTQCYDHGAQHPTGSCATCDTTQSSDSWTILSGCLIADPYAPPDMGGTCYTAGQVNPSTGCGICDPTKSATEWSPIAGKCAIPQYFGGPPSCYADGAAHPTGSCAKCDTTQSSTGWTVVSDCLISDGKGEQCYTAGATDPMTGCGTCDPTQSHTSWTPLSGKCLIAFNYPGGPPMPPQCFNEGVSHPTGSCAKCDTATSATLWTVVNGCLIDGQCQPTGATDPSGCQVCDPTRSQTAWSPANGKCAIAGAMPCTPDDPATPLVNEDSCPAALGAFCMNGFCVFKGVPGAVGTGCYNDGATHPTGSCAVCDAANSATEWTLVSGCLIDDQCVSDGAKQPGGCLACDATSPLTWSPVAGVSKIEYHFDSGTTEGVTLSPKTGAVGWQLSTKRRTSGTHALYYGDPATGSYDTPNLANAGTVTLPGVALPASQKALLVFSLWMQTDLYEWADRFEVKVGGSVAWSKTELTYPTSSTWREIVVDLSARAGQTVAISFTFDTIDPGSNSGEGVYLDAIRVLTGCP